MAASENGAPLSQEQKQQLAALIKGAATKLPADKEVKALALGLNWRINVLDTLKAAYNTTKACITTVGCVLIGHASPLEVIEIGRDVWHALIATCGALAETMTPLEYTACVYLSSRTDPITEADFNTGLTEFLTSAQATELPWYMGMTRSRVQTALKELLVPDGFAELMAVLRNHDRLIEQDGKVNFKPRNITLGLQDV